MVGITPAIIRDYTSDDRQVEVLSKPYEGVSSRRGWGDSGYRVEIVSHDCPADYCSHDRMIRRHDVNAELADTVRYWCLNPNCLYFVRDELSYACKGSYPNLTTEEPAVSERRGEN